MKSALVSEVIRGLNLARGDWSQIAREAGASYSWVSKLVCGEIHKPGAPTIEKIYLALVRRGHLNSSFTFEERQLNDCA